MISDKLLKNLVDFRKFLHQNPSLSGQEEVTVQYIIEYLKAHHIHTYTTLVNGRGLLVTCDSGKPGPVTIFRSDHDALPLQENPKPFQSSKENIAHLCGHDGHTSAMLGYALALIGFPPEKGKILLLFQPAEETGQGALEILNDPVFKSIKPDAIFGFHNLPSYEKGTIVSAINFASASTGMIIEFQGTSSHAAHPEKGKNPARAISRSIEDILSLNDENRFSDFYLATIIHSKIGEQAFGTSPGYGELMLTLRATLESDMEELKKTVHNICTEHAAIDEIKIEASYAEPFPATHNTEAQLALIEEVASELNINIHRKEKAFRWSEDFGYYLQKFPGCFFGIGAGNDHPPLHHPDYDFPDSIISVAISMFEKIAKKIHSA